MTFLTNNDGKDNEGTLAVAIPNMHCYDIQVLYQRICKSRCKDKQRE